MGQLPPRIAAEGNRAQYDTAFQTSPIILQDGIVASMQGHLLPISAITGFGPPDADGTSQPFARYSVVPGSTLISQAIGMYPFANQTIAANATIQQPLTISLQMIAPVNQPGGYLTKLHVFTALQSSLALHNASGGTYIVATPAYIYKDLLMTQMIDLTSEESRQKQISWQFDFIQPILTQAAAAAQESQLLQAITRGSRLSGPYLWHGLVTASPATYADVKAALATFGGGP